MANIEMDSNRGYDLITEKIVLLTNDINTMIENGEISKEIAGYLLEQYRDIAKICVEHKNLSLDEKIDEMKSHPISF